MRDWCLCGSKLTSLKWLIQALLKTNHQFHFRAYREKILIEILKKNLWKNFIKSYYSRWFIQKRFLLKGDWKFQSIARIQTDLFCYQKKFRGTETEKKRNRQKKINEKLAKLLRCNFFGNVRTCIFWKIRSIFFQSAKFYAKTTVSIADIAISKKSFFWGQLSLMGCNLNFVKIF